MGLSFKQTNAITGIAKILAEFLPYSGAYENRGQVTTRTICQQLGVSQYWEKTSKNPGLVRIMGKILEHESNKFENFVQETVREGIGYRQKNKNPITRQEIETLNGLIARGCSC